VRSFASRLSSITVPVPFPGRSFENLIRSFSLLDVHFKLPDPTAEPDDPWDEDRGAVEDRRADAGVAGRANVNAGGDVARDRGPRDQRARP